MAIIKGDLLVKIGIIVHSHTGNTLSVAQRLKEALAASGHSVALERVTAVNENPNAAMHAKLKIIPDTSSYDMLIFGAPVRGFSLSPVMKLYLAQLPALNGKKVGCFLTQSFPHPAMGGNQAMVQFRKACVTKGASIFETCIVNWSMGRERRIANLIEKMGKI